MVWVACRRPPRVPVAQEAVTLNFRRREIVGEGVATRRDTSKCLLLVWEKEKLFIKIQTPVKNQREEVEVPTTEDPSSVPI